MSMRGRYMGAVAALAVAAPMTLASQSAGAVTYGFGGITNNNAGDVAIGESQFFVDVTQTNGDVMFAFRNTGPAASVISEVYFDETSDLLDDYVSENNVEVDGVSFLGDAPQPPVLPGGNNATPDFDVSLGFDAESPSPKFGVDPNEELGLVLSLTGTSTFNDIINALNSGDLRIGVHAQAFASGGSESFVNTAVIPLPASVLMLLGALGGLGIIGARRRAYRAA